MEKAFIGDFIKKPLIFNDVETSKIFYMDDNKILKVFNGVWR